MSTYQYYDFYAIDRPLTTKEQKEVDALSSRFSPTSRRATYEYHYSDFRHDEKKVLRDYFDMMIYVANWGTWQLMIKVPIDLVSWDELIAYEYSGNGYTSQHVNFEKTKTHIIIDMYYSTEDGADWMDAEGNLDGMLQLREQILEGDYRILYLAWLHIAAMASEYDDEYDGEEDDEDKEKPSPPVPPNMNKLNIPLENFIAFWSIDKDLVTAASKNSMSKSSTTIADLAAQIIHLSEKEKNRYLELLLTEENKAKYQLKKRLSDFITHEPVKQEKKQTFEAIQAGVEQTRQARLKKEKKEAEAARIKALKDIGKREAAIWREAEYNADFKTSKGYDQAADALKRLKDYAIYANKKADFESKLAEFLEKYGRSAALRRRLKNNEVI